eukprot:5357936-Alexandrium_andersonii.AAC.1
MAGRCNSATASPALISGYRRGALWVTGLLRAASHYWAAPQCFQPGPKCGDRVIINDRTPIGWPRL